MGQPRGKPTQEASTVPKAGGRKGRAGSLEPGNGVGGSKLELQWSRLSGVCSHRRAPATEAESKEEKYPDFSLPPVLQSSPGAFHGYQGTKQGRGRGSRMDLRAPGPGLAHGRWVWGSLYFPKMATLILLVLLVFLER